MGVYKQKDTIQNNQEQCNRETDIEILKINQGNINSSLERITLTLDKFSEKFDKIMISLEGQVRIEEKLTILDRDMNKLEKNLEDSYRYRQKVDDMEKEMDRIHAEQQKSKYWIYSMFGTLIVFMLTFAITQINDINKNTNKTAYTKKNP